EIARPSDLLAVRKFCPLLCLRNSLWLDGVRLAVCNSFSRNCCRDGCVYLAYSRWNAPDQSRPARKLRAWVDGRLALRSWRLDHSVRDVTVIAGRRRRRSNKSKS